MRSSKDIATAIQWARHYADTLHIDKDNIFLVGQSRGSLAVLTALMADQAKTPVGADPPWVDESSLPQAVFAAQAQTTYRDTQLKNFFIKQYASASVTTSIVSQPIQFPRCRQDSVNLQGPFDYWCHYDLATQDFSNSVSTPLSSYDELDGGDTRPIWIRYERTPLTTATITKSGLYVNDPGTYQDNPNIDDNGANCFETTDPEEKVLKCFDVHHPNFGAKLRLKWQNIASPASHVIVQYAGTINATQREEARLGFFDKYFCFFMQYQPAGGDVIETLDFNANEERVKSIIAENATREPDEQVPTAKCTLRESEAWTY
jgi:alpha/beta hydrolase fold